MSGEVGRKASAGSTSLSAKWQLDAALLSRPVDLTALVSMSRLEFATLRPLYQIASSSREWMDIILVTWEPMYNTVICLS